MSLVVLEGPDCSGKSTLAKELQLRHGAFVIHAERRWLSKMWLYHNAILEKALKLSATGKLVVLDRHWPSEQVYGSVFRNGGVKPKQGRLFDRVMQAYGAVYVWCFPANAKAYLERYARHIDPDHPYDSSAVIKVWCAYYDLINGKRRDERTPLHPDSYGRHLYETGGFAKGRFDSLHYDIDDGTTPEVMAEVVLEKLKDQADLLLPTTRNASGSLRAGTLIVGEETNPNKLRADGRRRPWPFHDDTASSYFLCEQLDRAGIREESLLWTNAYGPDEPLIEETLRSDEPMVKLVALGAKAALWANQFQKPGRKFTQLPHPSWVKRFASNAAAAGLYAAQLKEAING